MDLARLRGVLRVEIARGLVPSMIDVIIREKEYMRCRGKQRKLYLRLRMWYKLFDGLRAIETINKKKISNAAG